MTRRLLRTISITILILVGIASPSYSQEEVTEGRESLETVRAFTKPRPLFIGLSYEQLFPLIPPFSSVTPNVIDDGPNTKVLNKPSPMTLGLPFVTSPYLVLGVEFPFAFGLSFPVSIDLYTRFGVSYRALGQQHSPDGGFIGLISLDLIGDLNVRFAFLLHRYSVYGLYVTTGVGVSYPIEQGHGYFSSAFSIDKTPHSEDLSTGNYTDFSSKTGDPDIYLNLGAGFLLQQLQSRNFKVILGYAVKWYLFQEEGYSNIVRFRDIPNNTNDYQKHVLNGLNLLHGVQIEFIYSIF